jgi:hypothetical protein
MVAREGEHCVCMTCVFSKRTPVAAKASRCGVVGSGLPYAECASARSVSGNINTKFMRPSPAARGDVAADAPPSANDAPNANEAFLLNITSFAAV